MDRSVQGAGARIPDFLILGVLAACVGAGLWMQASTLVAVGRPRSAQYFFLSAPLSTFIAALLGAFALLAVSHVALLRRIPAEAEDRGGAFARVAYAAPLSLLALLLLPLIGLLGPPPRSVLVLSYLLVDLRGWYVLVVAVLFGWALATRAGYVAASSVRSLPIGLAHGSLAAAAIAFALASSPDRRFESVIVGDEPRYLRYAESFFQGHGFDISQKVPFDQYANGSADRRRQFSLLVTETGEVVRELGADAVRWVSGEYRAFDPGSRSSHSFVTGRDGGTYQLHMPGLAALLYPFYYIDRQYLNTGAGYGNELPAWLLSTGAALLGLYVLWGILIYRFLVRYTNRRLISWLLAFTSLATVPISPFNFQYYPEVAAGAIVLCLVHAVLFGSSAPPHAALFYGLMVGFLPWLHVRFLVVSLICAGAFVVRWRRAAPSLAGFAAGYLVLMALLALYFHYVTGSVLPTAMYGLSGHGRLDIPGLPAGLAGFLFDRRFGILPYSPVYFVAFLGLVPFLIERRREAMLICPIAVSLVLLAAAYVPWTGGTSTPARLIVAVVPFAMLPLAHAVERFGASRVFRAIATFLLLISIHNAFVYNANLGDRVLRIRDQSFSGWKTMLLFPRIWGGGPSEVWPTSLLVAFWVVIVAALVLMSWRGAKRPPPAAVPFGPWQYSGLVAAIVLVAGAAGGLLTQPRKGFDDRLMIRPEVARERVLRMR